MSDKLLEHLIAQNDVLLRHVLGDTASPADVVATRELEEELAGVNRKLTEVNKARDREWEESKKIRTLLYKERDENKREVSALKAQLLLSESKVDGAAFELKQVRAELKQAQIELARAKQAGAPGDLVDEISRLLGHAMKAFEDDDQDKLIRNITLALKKVTLTDEEAA